MFRFVCARPAEERKRGSLESRASSGRLELIFRWFPAAVSRTPRTATGPLASDPFHRSYPHPNTTWRAPRGSGRQESGAPEVPREMMDEKGRRWKIRENRYSCPRYIPGPLPRAPSSAPRPSHVTPSPRLIKRQIIKCHGAAKVAMKSGSLTLPPRPVSAAQSQKLIWTSRPLTQWYTSMEYRKKM